MKKMILKLSGVVASLALVVTFVNVNTACMFLAHQPELPKGAEKLRKF
ncbi:cyclic lactone autoinducer peptide [Tissierellaceae bacterium HCP3S3_D8]